jgi:hypothetical protein
VLVTEPEKKREIGFGLLPTRVLKQLRDLQILDDISVWSSSETETQEQKQHRLHAVTQKRSLSMPPPSTLSLSSSSVDSSASIPNSSTSLSTTPSPTLSRHSTKVGGKMLFRPKSMMIRSTSLERANRTKHAAQILQQHNSHSLESSSSFHTNSSSSDGTSLSNHHHINPLRIKRNRSFREVALPNRPGFVTVQVSDGSRIEIASWKFGLLPRNAIEVSLVKRYEVHEELTDRFIYAATNLATLAYTFLASTALEPLNCIPQPDGTYLLKTAAEVFSA